VVKIKICGVKDLVTAELLAEKKVNFIGFVFAESSRQISAQKAARISRILPSNIKKVGVFVNEKISVIERLVEECNLDIVQLHGNESPEYCLGLKKCQVIKAFKVKDRNIGKESQQYPVDYLLLDSFTANAEGGSGKSFDWELTNGQTFNKPVILAGGLNSINVQEAIEKVNPYAVDVSSGVETNGVKDVAKIIEFIEKVRGVNHVA